MDLSRVMRGEAIAAIFGAALIAVMFLGWWGPPETVNGIDLGEVPEGEKANAWEGASFNDVIWFAAGAAALALGVLAATQTRPNLPIAWSAIVTILGFVALVLIVVRLVDPPGVLGIDLSRELGAWLGLVAILGIVVGGWTAMRDEGTSFGDQVERVRDQASGPGDDPPPPRSPSQPPAGGGPPA